MATHPGINLWIAMTQRESAAAAAVHPSRGSASATTSAAPGSPFSPRGFDFLARRRQQPDPPHPCDDVEALCPGVPPRRIVVQRAVGSGLVTASSQPSYNSLFNSTPLVPSSFYLAPRPLDLRSPAAAPGLAALAARLAAPRRGGSHPRCLARDLLECRGAALPPSRAVIANGARAAAAFLVQGCQPCCCPRANSLAKTAQKHFTAGVWLPILFFRDRGCFPFKNFYPPRPCSHSKSGARRAAA
jgi:hypothetical protein